MDNTKQSSITAISIGPGIRGIERGVSRVVRFREIALVEIESFIIENLVAEMEQSILDPAVIWSDAKTFPAPLFRGKVNLLFAGYPCQPFSNAGQRKGKEDPRHLYPYIERTIDIIRPDMCFFENVRGHITLGLREVIESLEGLGYRVHWGIFSAEETGASHKRERVFIMAIREDCLDNASGNRPESNDKIPARRDSTESASELADTGHIRQRGFKHQSKEQQEKYSEEFFRGNQLADSNNDGERTWIGEVQSQTEKIEGAEHREERHEENRKRSGAESGYCSVKQLEYTTEQRFQKSRQGGIGKLQTENREGIYDRFELTSESELGDTKSNYQRNDWESEQSRKESIGGSSNKNMGNANISGLQRRFSQVCGECSYEWITRANESFARKRHVARPGQPQHDWESPRTIITKQTARLLGGYGKKYSESFSKEQIDQVAFDGFTGSIKSHLDMSAYGHNFREDFLRALGNSVYEQTAELAFRTLLKKHRITLNPK